MNRSVFVVAAFLTLFSLAFAAQGQPPEGPVLVTIAGDITETNRGPLDEFQDAFLARMADPFDKAYALDGRALAAMPQTEIVAEYEGWDGEAHSFTGPLVSDILALVGAEGTTITFVGLDGYAAAFERAVLEKAGFILATHMDGVPMGIGGYGPTWLMVSPEIEPAFPEGKPDDGTLVWSTFFILVE